MEKIKVKILRQGAKLPTYGSAEAAGADLYAYLDEAIDIAPGEAAWVKTGIAVQIPRGFGGFIYARSSMGVKRDLAPANKVGVIDSDYRGEINVVLHNHGSKVQRLEPGERIAQLVIAPVFTPGFEVAEELEDTTRGEGGFGSTGR